MTYTPAHIRRRKRRVHAVEVENADLRRRLAAVTQELDKALSRLRNIATFNAWVREGSQELQRRVDAIAEKAGDHLQLAAPVLEAERRAAEEAKQRTGRATIYVADTEYNRSEREAS